MSTEVHAHAKPVGNPLLSQLALVESQLLSLQDVSINTSTLSGSGRDNGVQTTSLELFLQSGLNLSLSSESLSLLLLYTLRLLLWLVGILTSLLLTSATEVLAIVCFVPLTEGGGIDLDDGGLGEGVGSDEFVVRGMEGNDDDTDLAGDALRGPGKVAGFEAEGTEFAVTTTSADKMDSLGSDTCVGFLSAGFECALLPCKFLVFRLEHMSFDVWAFYYAR